MIANSQPYNPPSQLTQQQRCIGINNSNSINNSTQDIRLAAQKTKDNDRQQMNSRQLTPSLISGQQQQQQQHNVLYGSTNLMPTQVTSNSTHQRRPPSTSHVFDLANLTATSPHQQQQQQHSGSLFDSAYDDTSSSLANNNNQQQNNQVIIEQMLPNDVLASVMQHNNNNNNSSNKTQHNDMSLYSPSSSTSLLYHVYDQINVPTTEQQQQQQHQNNNVKQQRSQTTTILNPANLFSSSNSNQQQQQFINMQQHLASQLANNNHNKTTTIAQQELYTSGAQYNLNQPTGAFNTLHHHHNHHHHHHQLVDNYALNEHQLVLDTILRQQQQHAISTTTRAGNQHHRPLSSSGASSMSGHSMALTYGRQARGGGAQLPPPLPAPLSSNATTSSSNTSTTKNTLASVLRSSHHQLGAGQLTPTTLESHHHHPHHPHHHHHRAPKKLTNQHHNFASTSSTRRHWKRMQQRVRRFAYEYSTLLKCLVLLILLAFSLMSIIKFTLLNNQFNTTQTTTSTQPNSQTPPALNYPSTINYPFAHQQHLYPQHHQPIGLARPTPLTTNDFQAPTSGGQQQFDNMAQPAGTQQIGGIEQQQAPDVFKSKLLIGEFVVLNHNYSSSAADNALLAENIVKLMDQVFLSTEVRKVYSRMEIKNIRRHKPAGIIVDCHILLSESITYAAQHFGIVLVDSLTKTNERLANQANFIIDKNSIRFNTVPDKDLDFVPNGQLDAPQSPPLGDAIAPPKPLNNLNQQQQQDNTNDAQAVVWSEWSQWSSCVDKNGFCDPQRLHSRLRKCVSQHTGEQVSPVQCRQRFSLQDMELEVSECASSCAQSGANDQSLAMSDAPSVIQPHTAPPSLFGNPLASSGGGSSQGSPSSSDLFAGLPALKQALGKLTQASAAEQPKALPMNTNRPVGTEMNAASSPAAVVDAAAVVDEPTGVPALASSSSLAPLQQQQTTSTSTMASSNGGPTQQQQQQQQQVAAASDSPLVLGAPVVQQQIDQQMSCSNCTSDEICLLLESQKVPFCAKIKDRQDESGCGGWCKPSNQLCQPLGTNAFKCIQDDECLADEWRCHNSQCIPISKRCDGHSNCYDNSDERNCPALVTQTT